MDNDTDVHKILGLKRIAKDIYPDRWYTKRPYITTEQLQQLDAHYAGLYEKKMREFQKRVDEIESKAIHLNSDILDQLKASKEVSDE